MPHEIRFFVPESFDELLRATNEVSADEVITPNTRMFFVCGLIGAFADACEKPEIRSDIFLLNDDEINPH